MHSPFLFVPGYLVEGFLVRNETWTLIGSQLSMGKVKVRTLDCEILHLYLHAVTPFKTHQCPTQQSRTWRLYFTSWTVRIPVSLLNFKKSLSFQMCPL